MAELDYETKRAGLRFSAELKAQATEAPHPFIARELRATAHRIEKYFGFTTPEKKRIILKFIEKSGGTSSIPELNTQFPWDQEKMRRLVGELVEDSVLEYFDGDPAGCGPGRKARRIRLVMKEKGNSPPPRI